MRRAGLILGWCWALPTSLVGLVLAVLGGATPYRLRPAGVWQWSGTGGLWGRFFESEFTAITFGAVTIFNPRDTENPVLIRHEKQHTYQAMALGALFLPAYGLASLWAVAVGLPLYLGNWFERQAYAKQGEGL